MVCSPDCVHIVCNGDSGCRGVKGIEVNGSEPDGAAIDCNGDHSCISTTMTGTGVGSIGCTGDASCAYSTMDLDCVADGCLFRCVGDNSCQGHLTDPAYAASYTVRNTNGILCASHACQFGVFTLTQNLGGLLICGAERACFQAQMTINNVGAIICSGFFGCEGATFLVINPEQNFYVDCQQRNSCKDLSIEIIVTDPMITEFRGISCGGASSCEGAVFTITKRVPAGVAAKLPADGSGGSTELVIAELSCAASRSCANAVFDMPSNVAVEACGCAGGTTGSCEGLLGVDSCIKGLEKLECVGTGTCAGMVETITNPKDGFMLICNDPGSCNNFVLTINVDSHPNAPTFFGGIQCNSIDSCKGLRLFILNTAPGRRLDVGGLNCGSTNSCNNAALVMRNADLGAVNCATPDSCTQCATFIDNKFAPCG
eukprot:CAMPEP_0197073192 /NCGR_PEP_ID=MMETSP1384-20130603/210483_1 /TAXON_ID=29189 /ORGANISM="Ammonia sp." /LENGTH=427 /DNA_ID=CAMNT_0042512025 /DNA_START=471 /DNA_END=1754 /DNA_ORIENTATION=+